METVHLKEFVYLAESLSFKRTAEHFYVSRSVISRHLAALEESVGARLVDRGGHAISLTEAGESFYRDAQVVLRDLDIALEHVSTLQQSRRRMVMVGYLRNAARPVIVRFVKLMQQKHPELNVILNCMEYPDLRRAMDEGSVDVAIAVNVNPEVSRNYRSTCIYSDRFFAVMGKDNPLAEREGVGIDELPEEKLLLPDSFVYAGLSELIGELVDSKSRTVAREYYRDVDMLYLKVQTEGYIALSSGMNNAMFGESLAIVPLTGADSLFAVSAFYRDNLDDEVYEPCRKAFEACRDAMASLQAKDRASQGVGISLQDFD